ncbi:hypothetical protein GWK47_048620 [Chionoecetes opilio]|uniref:Uncharacterized protein n=1 Tax=Chionoecetes opilio TaxID=41210 RepID=A0A8J4YFH3_CHIOP|nr:hypothetical protein GWK47_048620 [Chionoecetes opilio]
MAASLPVVISCSTPSAPVVPTQQCALGRKCLWRVAYLCGGPRISQRQLPGYTTASPTLSGAACASWEPSHSRSPWDCLYHRVHLHSRSVAATPTSLKAMQGLRLVHHTFPPRLSPPVCAVRPSDTPQDPTSPTRHLTNL